MGDEKLVKVVLHNRGADVETPWAEDLGPGEDGGRRVRLDNVPFLHAKPTFGDVIVAREDVRYDGQLAWDREGAAWERIGERIDHDGGRYAMIVDYAAEDVDRFGELSEWLGANEIVPEGCFGPTSERPGRLYLAVPRLRAVDDVMALLAGNDFGFAFMQIHPEPTAAPARTQRAKTAPPPAPPARAKTAPPAKKAQSKPKAKPAPKPKKKPAPKPKKKPAPKPKKKPAPKPKKKPAPKPKKKPAPKPRGKKRAARAR